MGYFSDCAAARSAPSGWPILPDGTVIGAALELPPDPPPRRVPDNRHSRRDYQHGRSYLARCLRRGGSLPWHGHWPPVWAFDVVPVLRERRDRGAQSARWAAGVVIMHVTGDPDEQWTVAACSAGNDPDGNVAYLRVAGPALRGLDRCRRAEAVRAALHSRTHLSVQPTHAP